MFKPITEIKSNVSYNSDKSRSFFEFYEKVLQEKYYESERSTPSKTFAPSSIRCMRYSFFRLRGVEPDREINFDKNLQFSAMVGTACHEEIQKNLKQSLGENWISVPDYLDSHDIIHDYKLSEVGEFESRLEFFDPPVKFGCDGLIKFENDIYVLEIKTSDHNSFKSLSGIKPSHIDQIKCYCSLLEINKALVLYQDRAYGDIKCFELLVSEEEMNKIFDDMRYVQKCVSENIAPPKLESKDYWCTYCKFKKRCDQWG